MALQDGPLNDEYAVEYYRACAKVRVLSIHVH